MLWNDVLRILNEKLVYFDGNSVTAVMYNFIKEFQKLFIGNFLNIFFCFHFLQICNLYLIVSLDSYIYDDLGVDTHLGYILFHNDLWPYTHIMAIMAILTI